MTLTTMLTMMIFGVIQVKAISRAKIQQQVHATNTMMTVPSAVMCCVLCIVAGMH